MSQKNYHHGDLAESLIHAALVILEKKGPQQLSLREIARDAGVSHSAPAHHFGDKTGLLNAIAVRGHEKLEAKLIASQTPKATHITKLKEAGKAYVNFAMDEPGYFSALFLPELIAANKDDYITAKADSRQVLEDCVQALFEDNPVNQDRVAATLTALWSQTHGFSVLWLAGNFGNPNNKKRFEKLLDEILESIKPNI